jgi:Asp-tRNA(Asn)/Glu-tRNA(Gln) amidotransferase A subunit family amidase
LRASKRVSLLRNLDRDGALARARELDKAGGGGLAAGVPFGAKDIIDIAEAVTKALG